MIHDDGDEVTAYVGHFTHSHFSSYDDISEEAKAREISEDVMIFLEDLFADRVLLWGSHEKGGGWHFSRKTIYPPNPAGRNTSGPVP